MLKIIIVAVAALGLFLGNAAAQVQFYGADGSYLGQATRSVNGGSTFYGADGSYLGQATPSIGGGSTFYGADGSYLGQATPGVGVGGRLGSGGATCGLVSCGRRGY